MPFNAQIIPVNARALRDEYTTRPVNHKIHPPFQELDNRSSQHDRVEANLSLVFAIIERSRISTYYLSHTFLHVTNTGCTGLGGAALAHTGLSFVPSGPASSSFLL
jgi:hypothetical protein